jgi:hypothetical protein
VGRGASTYVYCDKKQPGLKRKSVTEKPAAITQETVTARCGRGKEAVSGGFEVPDTKLVLTSSRRAGKRAWEVGYIRIPGTPITAFVLCDKSKPGLKTKEASATASSESETLDAKCKRRQELRSGGFYAEYDYPSGEDISSVNASKKEGRRKWMVSATGADGTPVVTAYAYRDKKEKKG